ncbi:MAG TPA: hypothetical protein VMF59_02020, partial [Bacteroidota bacterium]|nr:hypothetical protein [Bacteroidota bacterium]
MNVLMRSGEVSVTEEGGLIFIRSRVVTLLLFFAIGIAAALVFAVLSVAVDGPQPALGAFARWGATVLALVSLCFPVAAGWASAARRVTIDASTRTLSKGRRRWAFADITGIAVRRRVLLLQEVYAIVATVKGAELILVSGHTPKHASDMERAAARIASFVFCGREKPEAATAKARIPSARASERFVGLVLMIFGTVFSVTAGLMIPDLLLTGPGAGFGFLFWPVGIWIAVPGLLELLDI